LPTTADHNRKAPVSIEAGASVVLSGSSPLGVEEDASGGSGQKMERQSLILTIGCNPLGVEEDASGVKEATFIKHAGIKL
jgi:hypothetical protein